MNKQPSERIIKGGEISKRRAKYILSLDKPIIIQRVDGETKYYVGLYPKEVH